MPAEEAVALIRKVADGLAHCHDNDIIHRDIKPENIMLRPDGFVKVVDFGLARMSDPDTDKGSATLLTRAGQVPGTVQYLSPEQVLGSQVTSQSDIFSLGVVAYELASGVRPFDGATDGAIFDAILHRDPLPPSAVRPQLGTVLDGLIMGAIERDPDFRFQSAAELSGACKRCERLLANSGRPAAKAYAPLSSSKLGAKERNLWMGASAALLIICGALYFTRPLPEARVTRNFPITTAGRVTAFVNDGTWLYYSAGNAGSNTSFYVISAKGGSARELAKFRGMAPLDISSDHSEILLGETDKGGPYPLWVGPVFGSEPHRLGDLRGFDAHWSSRGDKIVYTTGKEIRVANSDGSGARVLFDRVDANGHMSAASFFDDDRRIRFHTAANNVEKIWDMNSDGSDLHAVLPDWSDALLQADPTIARDSRYSAFTATANGIDWDLWLLPESSGLFSFRGPKPVRLTTGPLTAAHPQFTQDSRHILYVGDSDETQLVRYDARSSEWTPYLGGMSAFQLDFSRDGEWVTYVAPPGHSVWCSRIDGSQATQVTLPPLSATNPRFSPDRSKIVFYGYQPGHRTGMFLVPPSGGSVVALVPKGKDAEQKEPNWSPDGLKVMYSAERSLWVMDLATGDAQKLPGSEGLGSPRWSPDGQYAVAADAEAHLWLYNMTDHRRVVLTTVGAEFPTWSRDSKSVYFENADFSTWYRAGVEDRQVERVASLGGLHISFASMGWVGMTPQGAVVSSRDVSTRNIYALDWEMR
jgi:Tol biopolymer transport system component